MRVRIEPVALGFATTTRSDLLGLLEELGVAGVVLDGLDGAMVGAAVAQGRAVEALRLA